jgi:uncharacterized protein
MTLLGTATSEHIIHHYGTSALLSRLSDPFWFQVLGSVMGMDWNSSGITTSLLGALKRGLNPRSHELGVYICGGRGRHSKSTPDEMLNYADRTGLDGESLVRASRLAARVDNNAIADGFQIYLHGFVLNTTGEWAIVQPGIERPDRVRSSLSLAFGDGKEFHDRAALGDRWRTPGRDHEPDIRGGISGAARDY